MIVLRFLSYFPWKNISYHMHVSGILSNRWQFLSVPLKGNVSLFYIFIVYVKCFYVMNVIFIFLCWKNTNCLKWAHLVSIYVVFSVRKRLPTLSMQSISINQPFPRWLTHSLISSTDALTLTSSRSNSLLRIFWILRTLEYFLELV